MDRQRLCDFCNGQTFSRNMVNAEPMTVEFEGNDGYLEVEQPDAWLACDVCYQMICADRWDEVLHRGASTLSDLMPVASAEELLKSIYIELGMMPPPEHVPHFRRDFRCVK